MMNANIRVSLRVLTQLRTTQSQVVTNHKAAQDNLGFGPQPNSSSTASKSHIRVYPLDVTGDIVLFKDKD